MQETQAKAIELTNMAEGKHHIGDFLPPDELARFMEKVIYNIPQLLMYIQEHIALSLQQCVCMCVVYLLVCLFALLTYIQYTVFSWFVSYQQCN